MTVGFKKYSELGAYHWDTYFNNDSEWGNVWYREIVNKIILQFPDKGSVLDIGCGDGLISYLLTKQGLEVDGFDGEEEAIRVANEKFENYLFVAKIEEVELIADYDYMLACDFIEHIKDPQPLVDLFRDHCKNYMILSTDQSHFGLRRYDYHRYSIDDLKKLFAPYKVEFLFETDNIYAVKIKK